MGKLSGKTAIVTGAGQGIGAGIAHALAREGAAVSASGRTLAKVEQLVAEIRAGGGTAIAVRCDVQQRSDVDAMVARTVAELGPPNILINNAQGHNDGAHGLDPVETVTVENALGTFTGGPLSSLFAMQACFPYLRETGGRIVNLASTTGVLGMPGFAPYSMAKEAIRALTKTAANEWGRYGITVNAICPAALSPAARAWAEQEPEQFQATLVDTPLGRLGDPDNDIGSAVAMLVTDDMSYLTGATLMLDGGRCILR